MFADADKSRPADSRILEGYSWSDIDRDSFNQFRLLFGVAKPDHPWLASNDQELMRLLGGYRKDHRTGREGFTLAGLLMFGKTESITDPECCPYYMVDYREIPQDDSKIRWIDRVYPDGTWESFFRGNDFQLRMP
jgi:predicted HTH transcriptional regulator